MSFGAVPTKVTPEQQLLPANEKALAVRRQLSGTCTATGAVTTIAGRGSAAFADGIGSAASFQYPSGVDFSPDGSTIAVADGIHHRVRLINVATGAVTTIAGSGSAAFADGTGSAASFNRPYGVAYSPDSSTIAVADWWNHRVRLINVATGAVTTIAGSGSAAFADGIGSAASFNRPYGVAYSPDGSTIAVADLHNHRVRLINVATGAVTTIAGSGSAAFADGTGSAASFNSPARVAYSPDSSTIAVVDRSNQRVRLINVATGAVTTIAGSGSDTFADGTGSAASFNSPPGVAYSPDGSTIAVADMKNHRVRLINVATGAVTTIAGSGSAAFADGTGSVASFNFPADVAYSPDSSTIAVADQDNSRVREICFGITPAPTAAPTTTPTDGPTDVPTAAPTVTPTAVPTDAPTESPTAVPTDVPTAAPTVTPTPAPTPAPTLVPTALPSTAGYDKVFDVSSNLTLSGFSTCSTDSNACFTETHQIAVEQAMTKLVGQTVMITAVTATASGMVVVVYHIVALESADAAQALWDINQMTANTTELLNGIEDEFKNDGAQVPEAFGVTAAPAVSNMEEVREGMFMRTDGEWIFCPKGQEPTAKKDDCSRCLEGMYSIKGICQECPEGKASSPSRDTCRQEEEPPLYKQVKKN
jgi:DNA-binding beta-propeller fold protein YncE